MLDATETLDVRELLQRLPLGQYIELQRMANEACAPGLSDVLRQRKVEKIQLTVSTLKSRLGLTPMQEFFWSFVFGPQVVLSLEGERHA
jgi:hypothetical protein